MNDAERRKWFRRGFYAAAMPVLMAIEGEQAFATAEDLGNHISELLEMLSNATVDMWIEEDLKAIERDNGGEERADG